MDNYNARPLTDSDEKVDLHILIVPNSLWRPDLRFAYNSTCVESISVGFVRVYPSANLHALRDEVSRQLDSELFPSWYVFLRSIGKCLTWVSPKQESSLKTRLFLPPLAPCPEIYILDASCLFDVQLPAVVYGNVTKQPTTCYQSSHTHPLLQHQHPHTCTPPLLLSPSSYHTHPQYHNVPPKSRDKTNINHSHNSTHPSLTHPVSGHHSRPRDSNPAVVSNEVPYGKQVGHRNPHNKHDRGSVNVYPQRAISPRHRSRSKTHPFNGIVLSPLSGVPRNGHSDIGGNHGNMTHSDQSHVLSSNHGNETQSGHLLTGYNTSDNPSGSRNQYDHNAKVVNENVNPSHASSNSKPPKIDNTDVNSVSSVSVTNKDKVTAEEEGHQPQGQSTTQSGAQHLQKKNLLVRQKRQHFQMQQQRAIVEDTVSDGDTSDLDEGKGESTSIVTPPQQNSVNDSHDVYSRSQTGRSVDPKHDIIISTTTASENPSHHDGMMNSRHNEEMMSDHHRRTYDEVEPKMVADSRIPRQRNHHAIDGQHTGHRGVREIPSKIPQPFIKQRPDKRDSQALPRKRSATYPPVIAIHSKNGNSSKIMAGNKNRGRIFPLPATDDSNSGTASTMSYQPKNNHDLHRFSSQPPLPPISNERAQDFLTEQRSGYYSHMDVRQSRQSIATKTSSSPRPSTAQCNELLASIRRLKSECEQLSMDKSDMSSTLRSYQHTMRTQRENADKEWKRKYFHEKKLSSMIEDSIKKTKMELQQLQNHIDRKRGTQLRDMIHTPLRVEAPSEQSNVKNQCRRTEQTIVDLKHSLEAAKQRLNAERNAHKNLVEECKVLRKELMEKKIACTRTKRQLVSVAT